MQGILSDIEIIELCVKERMITPFFTNQTRFTEDGKVISFGPSSYGYDCRLSESDFKVFSPIQGTDINPKDFDQRTLIDSSLRYEDGQDYFLLPPHSYALACTIETFNIPRNITGIVIGKSTYARCGLIINCTPLEAGWKGQLVLEIYNAANLPIRVFAFEGIVQCLFFAGAHPCNVSYKDRGGKYQDQTGLTLAKV